MDKWKKHLFTRRSFLCLLVAVVIFVYVNYAKPKETRVEPKGHDLHLGSVDTPGPDHVAKAKETRLEPKGHKLHLVSVDTPGPYHVAYPRDYKFIMDDTEVCKTKSPFVVLIVPVAPGDVAARDAIRKTWGKEAMVEGKLIQTVFLIGLPSGAEASQQQEKLRQENLLHRDLIQSDFQDSYRNLTIKTMVMLEWLTAHCSGAAFVMKIDSDMFLNTQNLVKLLVDPSTPQQNYMTGLVWWHSPVLRDRNNKFYMPEDVFPESEYPPYPLGMSYVMSLDLPGKILGVSSQIKPIYIEDAYLGMCLKRLGISPTDPLNKSMFIVNPFFPLRRCSLSKVIAVTTTGISQMMDYWERNREPGSPC